MKKLETQEVPGSAPMTPGSTPVAQDTAGWFQQAWKPSLDERAYKISENEG